MFVPIGVTDEEVDVALAACDELVLARALVAVAALAFRTGDVATACVGREAL